MNGKRTAAEKTCFILLPELFHHGSGWIMPSEDEAAMEILDSAILTKYLLAQNLDFNNINNFSDDMVMKASDWYYGRTT